MPVRSSWRMGAARSPMTSLVEDEVGSGPGVGFTDSWGFWQPTSKTAARLKKRHLDLFIRNSPAFMMCFNV